MVDSEGYGGLTFEDYVGIARGTTPERKGLSRSTATSKSCYVRRPRHGRGIDITIDNTEEDDTSPEDHARTRPRSGSVDALGISCFLSPQDTDNAPQGLRRVRSFKTTSKGEIVNRGDSFKRKSGTPRFGLGNNEDVQASTRLQGDSDTSAQNAPYKVLMIGRGGVGKTALVQQFATSEPLGADTPGLDEYFEKSVPVQLDDKESTLSFFVLPSEEDFTKYEGVDAYVLVYSVSDKSSFKHAKEEVKVIRKAISAYVPILLVGNKSDIVRQRQTTGEDGKLAATNHNCKFIETSATLNHQVDELLVGILSQIRLAQQEGHKHVKHTGVITKFLQKHNVVPKSCDNLLVK